MRNNDWLEDKLYELWENHFVDVPRRNRVLIKFGRKSRTQLGCITWANSRTRGIRKLKGVNDIFDDPRISLINITGYFKDEEIPEEVVIGTMAHELCHYAHGFHSPLQQLYAHPHKGGVIRKELMKRELGSTYTSANKWLKLHWPSYLRSHIYRHG